MIYGEMRAFHYIWIVVFLINLVAGAVLGMLGFAAAGAAGLIPPAG